jgi:hypothetical protein
VAVGAGRSSERGREVQEGVAAGARGSQGGALVSGVATAPGGERSPHADPSPRGPADGARPEPPGRERAGAAGPAAALQRSDVPPPRRSSFDPDGADPSRHPAASTAGTPTAASAGSGWRASEPGDGTQARADGAGQAPPSQGSESAPAPPSSTAGAGRGRDSTPATPARGDAPTFTTPDGATPRVDRSAAPPLAARRPTPETSAAPGDDPVSRAAASPPAAASRGTAPHAPATRPRAAGPTPEESAPPAVASARPAAGDAARATREARGRFAPAETDGPQGAPEDRAGTGAPSATRVGAAPTPPEGAPRSGGSAAPSTAPRRTGWGLSPERLRELTGAAPAEPPWGPEDDEPALSWSSSPARGDGAQVPPAGGRSPDPAERARTRAAPPAREPVAARSYPPRETSGGATSPFFEGGDAARRPAGDAVHWSRSGSASAASGARNTPPFKATRPPAAAPPPREEPRKQWRAGDERPRSDRRPGATRDASADPGDRSGGPTPSPAVQSAAARLQPGQRPWIEAVAVELGESAAVELAAALAAAVRRPPARTFGGPVIPRNAPATVVRQRLLEQALQQIVDRTPVGGALLQDVREEIRRLDRLDTARALR